MTKHFFWGIWEGNDGDETWKILHEHFEKLAKEEGIEFEASERKAKPRRKQD
jgi:hypothetical protein